MKKRNYDLNHSYFKNFDHSIAIQLNELIKDGRDENRMSAHCFKLEV